MLDRMFQSAISPVRSALLALRHSTILSWVITPLATLMLKGPAHRYRASP